MSLDLTHIRRTLHQIPELGFELPLTSATLKSILESLGYTPILIAKSGWLVIIPGTSEDILMFRSDMDGLPLLEKNIHDYRSTNQNMHACGHDGHMSMLLGFADKIQGQTFHQTLVLLFQPAEESPGGAKVVLEELPFELKRVKGCFGLHLYPQLPLHQLGSKPYGFMATNGEIDITIHGQSAHAGLPHQGKDAVVIASSLMMSIQSILSRNTNPLESKVINFGVLKAGEVRNSVADTALLQGTLRAFSQQGYQALKDNLQRMIQAYEVMHDVHIECEIRDGYPVVYNDPVLYTQAKDVFKDQLSEIDGVMLAEDFGFYTEVMPSLFLFLGTGNPHTSLHSPTFDFDEVVLETGVNAYLSLLESFQSKS